MQQVSELACHAGLPGLPGGGPGGSQCNTGEQRLPELCFAGPQAPLYSVLFQHARLAKQEMSQSPQQLASMQGAATLVRQSSMEPAQSL